MEQAQTLVFNYADLIGNALKDVYMTCLILATGLLGCVLLINYKRLKDWEENLNFFIVVVGVMLSIFYFKDFVFALEDSLAKNGEKSTELLYEYQEALNTYEYGTCSRILSPVKYYSQFIFKGTALVGGIVKMVVRMLVSFAIRCLVALAPLFLMSLLIPPLRSASINYLSILFGLCFLPIAFLFGDILMIKFISAIVAWAGVAGVSAGVGGAAGTAITGASLGTVLAAAAIPALLAFGTMYLILTVVIYIGIPFAIISLLRGASMGHAISTTMNTASNISSSVKGSASGAAKGAVNIAGSMGGKGSSGGGGGGK